MQHQEKRAPALQVHCQQEWPEIGSALSQLLLRQLSYTLHIKHTGYRTSGFCLSRPLLSCSELQAIGLLCTKRLGRVAPLLGDRGFLPWQNDDVSVHYAVAPGALVGIRGFWINGLSLAQR